MIATASGRYAPRIMKSLPAKCAKPEKAMISRFQKNTQEEGAPGARILQRYGLFVPSDTKYTAISPISGKGVNTERSLLPEM